MTATTTDLKGMFPDQSFQAHDVLPEALLLKVGTHGGQAEGDAPLVRVPFVKTLPAGDFVLEGTPATPSEPAYDEELIPTRKLMIVSRQSREAARHQVAAELLASSMSTAIIRQANRALINGSPADSPGAALPGLAELAATTVTGGTSINLDAFIDAMSAIETAGGKATDIITDPATWAQVLKLKAGTGSDVPLVGSPAAMTDRTLYGCPVHVSPDVTEGTLLLVDSAALITVYSEVEVAVSEDAFFSSDSIARRVTWRIGWGMPEPSRLAKITFGAA